MGGLLQFLIRIRLFLLFLLLEGASIILLIENNTYPGIAYLNSSNEVVASVMNTTGQVKDYFLLGIVNDDLAAENAKLNVKLKMLELELDNYKINSIKDTSLAQYKYIVAKVVNNSVSREDNYLTINKGSESGLQPGMGVLSPSGVVGRVKQVSPRYATITSVLHRNQLVSAKIKRLNAFGTLRWKGGDPFKANLEYIARHIKPKIGDSVVTSAYSTVFPEGIMIGRIRKATVGDDETFYNIEVELATDYSTLTYVYVIENRQKIERDTLEVINNPAKP